MQHLPREIRFVSSDSFSRLRLLWDSNDTNDHFGRPVNTYLFTLIEWKWQQQKKKKTTKLFRFKVSLGTKLYCISCNSLVRFHSTQRQLSDCSIALQCIQWQTMSEVYKSIIAHCVHAHACLRATNWPCLCVQCERLWNLTHNCLDYFSQNTNICVPSVHQSPISFEIDCDFFLRKIFSSQNDRLRSKNANSFQLKSRVFLMKISNETWINVHQLRTRRKFCGKYWFDTFHICADTWKCY